MHKLTASIFALLLIAHAQNAYVQQFYAADLKLVPGKLTISTGDPVVLEFYGAVNTVIAGQPNPLTIDQLDTAIVLITGARSGTVPLTIEIDGNFLLFEVEIDNTDQRGRIYKVVERRERSYSPSTAIVPAPEPVARPTPPATEETHTTGLNLIPGEGVIYFSFTNTLQNRMVLDPSRVSVLQNGVAVKFEIVKSPLRNLVSPGEQQTGIIKLGQSGHFTVRWPVVSLSESGGRALTLEGSADVD